MAATRVRPKATKKAPVRRKKPVVAKAKVKTARRPAAPRRPAARRRPAAGAAADKTLPSVLTGSPAIDRAATEEERIESSKYLPQRGTQGRFEAERFVFPESYGVNRVRLLVKDPEWLFAHWDVDPAVMASLRKDLGERAVALSRLTLRVSDTVEGGCTVVLLPKNARGFYIRADGASRSYRAELGLTLPSGEFHPLAASNTVGTPRVGPASEAARARIRFRRSGAHATEAGRLAPGRTPAGRMADSRVVPEHGPGPETKGTRPGGASDTYRR